MSTSERIDKAAKKYIYYLIEAGDNGCFDEDEVLEYVGGAPFTEEEKDKIYSRVDELIASVTP